MPNCANCTGCTNCGGCAGCGGAMELTLGELEMLQTLSQIPFLPVARKLGEETPVYLEEQVHSPEEYSLILQCLEKRGLIAMDYSAPLKNFDMSAYEAYPVRGSFALTERGQQVVELLDYQGIQ